MKIYYLLASSELCGGVKVVFDQARALEALGHEVVIVAASGDHTWYPYPIHIQYQADFNFSLKAPPDALIATYWTTIKPALKMNVSLTFHLCQGYEGGFPELNACRAEIEAVYRKPIPKLTIGSWLSEHLLKVFGDAAFPIFTIGQVVDTELFKPPKYGKKNQTGLLNPPHILVVGDYWISCKGISDALHAIALLRKRGQKLHLARVTTTPLCDAEKAITAVEQSYVNVFPEQMASIYQDADILIAPNHSAEGFGLPLAEALASGVPSVATRIPSFLSFDHTLDYACFVPPHDPPAIAEAVSAIISDDHLKERLARRGSPLIQSRFNPLTVARRIQSAIMQIKQQKGI